MPPSYYLAPDGGIHFLDDDCYAGMLPPGSVPIDKQEADRRLNSRPRSADDVREEVLGQLLALDMASIRPLREGDQKRLAEINAQAATLRARLA